MPRSTRATEDITNIYWRNQATSLSHDKSNLENPRIQTFTSQSDSLDDFALELLGAPPLADAL